MSDEERKEIAEMIGKKVAWQLLDASKNMENLSSYTRSVIRKMNDCDLLRKVPSKDLRIKYGIPIDWGYIQVVWWLLEELEKGNVTIKEDVQSK